jgi:two-component system response regulator VanR
MRDKILVVDDDREIANLVALYLQNENYMVFKLLYREGEALECIDKTQLDLAILDIMLPVKAALRFVKGYGTSTRIR